MLGNADIRITNFFEPVGEDLTDERDNHKCSLCDRDLYMNKEGPL